MLNDDIEALVEFHEINFPATNDRIGEIQAKTLEDNVMQKAILYTYKGWPEYTKDIGPELHPFHAQKSQLSVANGLLLHRDRIVIPKNLHAKVLEDIYQGHWGITKCTNRALQCVWWPGIRNSIINLDSACSFCTEKQNRKPHQPLCTSQLPNNPWEKLGMDLFEKDNKTYLVVIDYFSRYIEMFLLQNTSTTMVISKLKNCFARLGLPESVFSDNGPQFSSKEFEMFCHDLGIKHETSSPHFPQSNGAAESAVKIAKHILSTEDPFKAQLNYNSTTLISTGISPAEGLYGRRIKTCLVSLPNSSEQPPLDTDSVKDKDILYKQRMAYFYNRKHGVKVSDPLLPGDTKATVKEQVAP
jgi:hypothetical protein